jgi:flagellar biosynthesis/type III secretory pathway M-ring protein FliF/YscJ
MGTGESTASITVQTAATYTVTTTNASGCTSLQGSGVAAPKTTPTAPVVNVVNNCDGTSTLTASEYRNFIMDTGESTASITVQTAATYTVTTTNASGCTSLQGSGVAAPKTTPTAR